MSISPARLATFPPGPGLVTAAAPGQDQRRAESRAATRLRVMVWDGTASRQLLVKGAGSPVVTVPAGAGASPAEIVTAIRRQLGMETAVLRVAAADLVEVELLDRRAAPPPGCHWTAGPFDPPAAQRPAWQRPGWLASLTAVLDDGLAQAGLRRCGPPVQVRHTSVTGLLQVPTTGGPVWVKAVLPIFGVEGPLVRYLAGIGRGLVPRVLADGDGWWAAAEFPAVRPEEPREPVLGALARLQIASAEHVPQLRALGCRDRSLPRLAVDIARLAGRADVLPPALLGRMRAVLPLLEDRCGQVDALGFPPSLVHGDLHALNVRWTDSGWFIFDWTDACVSHPVTDLAYTLLASGVPATTASGALAYQAHWARMMPPGAVRRALRAAPSLAAAHQAVSYAWIADAVAHPGGDEANRDRLLRILRYWVERLVCTLEGPGPGPGLARRRGRTDLPAGTGCLMPNQLMMPALTPGASRSTINGGHFEPGE